MGCGLGLANVMAFAEEFIWLSREVTGQDSDGNDVYEDTQTPVRGAFAPSGSAELVQGQLTVITHDTLYLAEGTPVPGAQDQFIARGITRDVDGMPEDYRSPLTGWHPGPVVRLVDVAG